MDLPADAPPVTDMLGALYELILLRRDAGESSSYVNRLFQRGHDVMCKKVGEEASEVIIASKNEAADELVYEMADLWFHSLVLLGRHNIHPH
ncbi:MAG: phosphoribosyl-ATP diphosphatase, partial [Candidatus Tectomicrobia bacterium]|nr:phosphoribosyl-ATP diphosphatase [Candidatus Tectomicrobia bacterium]